MGGLLQFQISMALSIIRHQGNLGTFKQHFCAPNRHHGPSTLALCPTKSPVRYFSSSSLCSAAADGDGSSCSGNTGHQTVESLARNLSSLSFKNVVVVMGAGASVSAGIPDFRTPGTGLYSRLQKYKLPYPEAIFDLAYYRENPLPFVDLCQSIWPGQRDGPKPTLSHSFLKVLANKGCLRRVYTQNIDGLESLAGISDDLLVDCHGSFRSASCISCLATVDSEKCRDTILGGKVPKCESCGSLVKPDIVFFGEYLPPRFQELVGQDSNACDLLLVIGTSLTVMPVAGIPSQVGRTCPRALLNRELVGDFVESDPFRDVWLNGSCDDSVIAICRIADWESDLRRCQKDVQ